MADEVTAAKWVLLVEDEAEERQAIADLFAREGIPTRSAAHGADAILVIEDHGNPAVILTDLIMPGMLGTSVVAYARSRAGLRDVPIAVVTGSPGLAPAGERVFVKPVSFGALLAFVRPFVAPA